MANCKVCGLHVEACLHQKEVKAELHDKRVSMLLWFSIGFATSVGITIIVLNVYEKYI